MTSTPASSPALLIALAWNGPLGGDGTSVTEPSFQITVRPDFWPSLMSTMHATSPASLMPTADSITAPRTDLRNSNVNPDATPATGSASGFGDRMTARRLAY